MLFKLPDWEQPNTSVTLLVHAEVAHCGVIAADHQNRCTARLSGWDTRESSVNTSLMHAGV